MNNKLTRLLHRIQKRIWLWWQRMRLRNRDFTIIASNCNGGIIYHDLGLKFLSPTINLDIPFDDFITLCSHLEYYMTLPIEPIESTEPCPVGVIRGQYGNVQINFRHYKTFEDGVSKWEDRKKRINWNNIFILQEAQYEELEKCRLFDTLPFEHKAVFCAYDFASSVYMPYDFYHNTSVAINYRECYLTC